MKVQSDRKPITNWLIDLGSAGMVRPILEMVRFAEAQLDWFRLYQNRHNTNKLELMNN